MKLGWANGLRGIAALALLTGAALTRAQAPPNAATANAAAKPKVVAVRIIKEDGTVLSEAPVGISVETGKALDRGKVAESMRGLYRTGNYSDLRAVAVAVEGGVRLDFVARENLFFNQVRIEGLIAPPSDSSAAAAMQLTLGQTYRKSAVTEALERLKETLREEGLYRAELSAEELPHAETHEMDIVVHVKPGPRARVGAIRLKNNTEYRDAEILSRLKMRVGREITSARLQRGTDRIRKFLVKRGHLSARAPVRRGEYDAAKNTIPLDLDVTEGPRVRVSVTGAKFSKGDLKKLIPVYQEGAVDADLLEEGKRNLLERLEREGYFDAEVDYETDTHEVKRNGTGWQGTEEVIAYTVKRGERHKLTGIEITGNKYFDEELLRSRLQIFGGAFASRGRFSRRLVESDAQSMRLLYLANGFLDAKVEYQIEDDYKGKEEDLFIHFNVREGRQTRVASLSIEGVHAFKEEELLGVIGSSRGQPYSEFGVTTDRDNILALYFNEGFPEASFTSTAERVATNADSTSSLTNGTSLQDAGQKDSKPAFEQADAVRLVYRIQEGPQTRARRILISGYEHTRQGVIRREIKIKANEPLRGGDVVESQRHLYNLGVFNRVTIEPQNPSGTNPDKDIAVLVEEAKRYTIAYGGGFEVQRLASTTDPTGGEIQAAPRGIFEISKQNVTGRADTLALKLRGSTIQGRALLAYTSPNTFNISKLSTQANAYVEKTQDINTFGQTRYEGNIQLTDQVTTRSSLLFRYVFRKVTVSNLNIPAEEVPLFNQPTLVSEFGTTYVRDYRNNPADATKGSFNTVDVSAAATSIGSSASFLRYFVQNSTYTPLSRNWNFARSLRIGILQPYGNTVSLSFPAPTVAPLPQVIPLPERLFAGGGTSIRGFALNQAGPRDALTGFPVGGQALVILNQEIRFPLKLPIIGTKLGGALFYDGGNVYSRASRVTLRWSPPKPVFVAAIPGQPPGPFNPTRCVANCTNELNYFSHTVGFGLRYATPIGPIRIDLGYQLNPAEFVIPCQNTRVFCQQGTHLQKFQIF